MILHLCRIYRLATCLTIEELKAFRDSVGAAYTFTEDYSVYATATTDETSGNFYKEVYVQAGNHAIQLRLVNAEDYTKEILSGSI